MTTPEPQDFQDGALRVRLQVSEWEVRAEFSGNTGDLDAGRFLRPIWQTIREHADDGRRAIVLDCCNLEFINSAGIAQLIELLKQIKESSERIQVLYDGNVKWQRLSFNMLNAFETGDGRIRIMAADE